MSHISKVDLDIKDIAALKKAVKRLKGTFKEGAKTYSMWGSNRPACDHAIAFPNCSYEVGVVKAEGKKSYKLEADFYSTGGLTNVIGNGGGMLKQAYAIEVAKKEAMMQGYTATEKTLKDGTIQLAIAVNQ